MSWSRRCAVYLVRHAAGVLPQARTTWADAMEHEVRHVEDDREALRWAVGCVRAGYSERIEAMRIVDSWIVRWLLALVIGCNALDTLFAPVLTLAWRSHHLEIAAFLGGFTPGDDYRRFIPLMDALPGWVAALQCVAAALFLLSAWKLLRNRRSAFAPFAAALLLALVTWRIERRIPVYDTLFSPRHLQADYAIFGLLALLGVAIWKIAHSPTVPPPRA